MSGPPLWKSVIDRVLGLVLLIVASLPMAIVSLAILLDGGSPVLIRQRRIGRLGNEYRMWKFRTLPVGTPEVAKSALENVSTRASRLGRFMRRYSIDEIPQLINVVTGEMSLVGPRPALYNQYDLTALREAAGVLAIRPGLTGLAQVNGRESLSLNEKVALDARYVRNLSPLLDLQIGLRTVVALFRSRGSF